MKKLKVVILSALVMTGLAGCGEKEVPAHEHSFASEWSSNETQHWHAATCEHTEEKSDVGNHTDLNHDGKCDVCSHEGLAVHHVDSGNGFCSCGVKIKVESVELDTSKAKLVYALGEELDVTEVVLTATFTDGSVAAIPFTASADLSSVGEKVVTLTYDTKDKVEDSTKATITYSVNVVNWDAKDIEVLKKATLLGEYDLVLPYLPGLKVIPEYDEDGELESWYAIKDDATLDDLQEYYETLNYYENVAIDEEYGITLYFKFNEVSEFSDDELAFIEEEYGFAAGDFFAFNLAPTYEGPYGPSRAFVADEYFIVGITADGELKVYDRYVTAYFEGYFGSTGSVDGDGYDVSKLVAAGYSADLVLSDALYVPYLYFTEFAEDYLILPSFDNEEGFIFFTSYKGVYPFEPYYDDIDMSVEIDCINGSQDGFEKFVSNLIALGFEKVEGKDIYSLEDEYLGSVTYTLVPYSDTFCDEFFGPGAAEYYGFNAGYAILVEYSKPELAYVTKLLPEAQKVVAALGHADDAQYEGDSEYLEEYAGFSILKDEEDLNPQAILADLASKLPAGYYNDGDAEYDEEEGCYYAFFTDGYTAIELDVYEPDEDGDVFVLLIFSEGYDIIETYVIKAANVFAEYIGGSVTPSPITGGYGFADLVGAVGGDDTAESLVKEIYDEFVTAGLVEEDAEAEQLDEDDYAINVISSDGQFEVSINVYVYADSYYVCSISIVSAAPWAGTAEEGFLAVVNALGIPEAYHEYAKTGGLSIYEGVPVSSIGEALNATLAYIESALPRGVEYVGSPAANTFYYQSADGLVTFIITVAAYYEDETETTVWTTFTVNVIETPAE